MRRCSLLLIAALCLLTPSSVLVAQSPPLTPFRGLIDPVTAEPSGFGNATGDIWHNAISGDGRFVVFQSPSSTIAADDYDDYNGWDDIFVRDRMTGVTTRVSKPADGGAGDGISGFGTISANGRYAAFASGSSNLVAGDTNYQWDVFVRDLNQQTTVRVSVATDGTQGDQDSLYPSLSADGRFVAFISYATTLGAPGVTSASERQIYLHDRDIDGNGIFDEPGTTATELISIGLDGAIADRSVDTPRVSSDGRYVLFESEAANLDATGNLNGVNHLYRRDRQTGQTEMIDRAATGGPSSWGISYGTADMSDDGRYITFSSVSHDIVWFDMNWQSQVFLYDTVAGPAAPQIVSKLPDGTLANGSSYATSVSGDGRYVLFTTESTNLASPPPDASSIAMLVARDMLDGSFARVDVLDNGVAFDQSDDYTRPAISADGTAIVLSSPSNNALINGYSGDQLHVFVLTALALSPMSATFPMAGGSGTIDVDTLAVTGWDASTSDSWIVIEGYAAPYPVHFAGPGTVHYDVSDNPSGIARDGWIRVGAKRIAIRQEGDGDPTPPVITPIITGTQVNGWYTSDITLTFEVSDPESEIVYLGPGCLMTHTITTDGLTSVLCEATSHGGTASLNQPLRRDTTPPTVWISYPRTMIFPYGSHVDPYYACYESLSPVTSCVGPSMSTPLDTWTRGRHTFTVTGTDEAGNTATQTVNYIVGYDQCITTPLAPANLKAWWMFDGNLRESIGGTVSGPATGPGTFQAGVVNQSWDNTYGGNYFGGPDSSSAVAGDGLTVAFWVKGRGAFIPAQYATIVYNPMQYHIVRWIDGTIRWAFNQSGNYSWVNTGIELPFNSWAHIAVTYKDGVVSTYLNGLLAHSQALAEPLATGPNTHSVQVAGRSGMNVTLNGSLDDLMIFDDALSASEVDNLALAGSGSLCTPFTSNLTVTAPQTITFGSAFAVAATLTDDAGRPLKYRPVRVTSAVTPGQVYENQLTDANGSILVTFPISSDVPIGSYPNGITVEFSGDNPFGAVQGHADLNLLPGTPLVYWEPEPLTYGTPLGAAQLNAVSMPGAYVYYPAAGTLLGAGPRTLSVTVTPDDPHWAQHTVWRTIVVSKATPTIELSSARPVYNGQPQAASATVLGVGGGVLTPYTVLYNGSTTPPVNAGTYPIEVQFAGDSNYAPTTATGTFTIDKATPAVTATGGTFTYDTQPHAGTGSAVGVLGETLTPVTVSYNGGSPTAPANAGTHTVRASFAGSSNYLAAESADAPLIINRAIPTVEYNTTTVWYTGYPRTPILFIRGVDGVELNPYTLLYDGSATAPTNANTYALEVQYAGSVNYEPLTASTSFVIRKNFPIFPTLVNYGYTYDGQPHGVNVTVVGVRNEQLESVTTYNGSTTVPVNAGVYAGIVRYDGSENYEADSRTFTLTIFKATPSLSWGIPTVLTYGQPLGPNQLKATANIPGTFVYTPPAGSILPAGDSVLSVTFVPTDPNYKEVSTTRSVTVLKADPQLTWPYPGDMVYGTPLSAAQLNATANTTGTFVYTPPAGTVLAAGQRLVTATFTPDDLANYNSGANRGWYITVAKAAPAVTWNAPAEIVYGTALSDAQLNATANVPGTFTYSPAAGAVLGAGARTLSVTFTPADAANYTTTTSSVTLNVTKAASTINWSNPADIVYGAALGTAQLNATANVAGTFSYSPATGTVLGAGTHTLAVSFTPGDVANYEGASATVTLNVAKAASTINWSNPANVTYGAALSGSQLNAIASVPGTFSYSPAGGTVLNAGSHTLSVTFTPDDAANYSGASTSVSLVVDKAATTVSWSNPAGIAYGTALSATQLNATASVPGSFTYSPAAGAVLAAGAQQLSVTFTPADAANYEPSSTTVSIAVAPAALTVQANNAAKVYGEALPSFTAGGSGFVNGDSMASLSGTLTFSTSATATSAPGSYSVTPAGVSSANYTIMFAAGTLTVNKASTSVTLTTTPNPSNNNQQVQLRAVVAAVAPGAGTATGTVEFRENGTLLGTATLVNGVATMTKNFKRGTHPLTATYTGNSDFNGSSGSVTHQTQ